MNYIEGWVQVAHGEAAQGYDWNEIDVQYELSTKKFFISIQSGCSCYIFEWEKSKYQEAGYDKTKLYQKIFEWRGGSWGNITHATRVIDQMHAWNPPKPLNAPLTD